MLDKYGKPIAEDSIIAFALRIGNHARIRKGRVIEIKQKNPDEYWSVEKFKMAWFNSDGTVESKTTWVEYDSSRIIVLD